MYVYYNHPNRITMLIRRRIPIPRKEYYLIVILYY